MAEGPAASLPVYSSLADFVVPVGLGRSFVIVIETNKNGQKKRVTKRLWRASGCAPAVAAGQWTAAAGERHTHRPSAVACAATGDAAAQAVDTLTTQRAPQNDWQTNEQLPFEEHAEDTGWLPGPVNGTTGRAFPAFTGRRPGPRDPQLTRKSTARRVMQSVVFTRRWKEEFVRLTRRHALAWRETHSSLDGVERAFDASKLRGEHAELFAAACVRIAQLNPAVPAEKLWTPTHNLYDPELSSALPYTAYQWINRHLAWGEYGDDCDDGDAANVGSSSAADWVPAGGKLSWRYAKRGMMSTSPSSCSRRRTRRINTLASTTSFGALGIARRKGSGTRPPSTAACRTTP
jgi:hypothetical protein